MRARFSWILPAQEEFLDRAWKEGILTVDANVLLDLYRYHAETRASLLKALEHFKGRIWLSHQSTEEFLRNRSKVISTALRTEKSIRETIETHRGHIDSTANDLKGLRILPETVIETFRTTAKEVLDVAIKSLESEVAKYPDYFKEDPILEQLMDLFGDAVSAAPDAPLAEEWTKEAQRRVENKIPPGYKNSGKEEAERMGDALLWFQVLHHAAEATVPVILVTSEQKEDWWEIIDGKRIGPRRELRREAHSKAPHGVLIYQTDYFVKMYAKRMSLDWNETLYEEIRQVSKSPDEHRQAVSAEQFIVNASSTYQEGVLFMNIRRPVFVATGTGHLDPIMTAPPNVAVEMREHPPELEDYVISRGAGTTFDFHVHLRSAKRGKNLPAGVYKFLYKAHSPPAPEVEVETETEDEAR